MFEGPALPERPPSGRASGPLQPRPSEAGSRGRAADRWRRPAGAPFNPAQGAARSRIKALLEDSQASQHRLFLTVESTNRRPTLNIADAMRRRWTGYPQDCRAVSIGSELTQATRRVLVDR